MSKQFGFLAKPKTKAPAPVVPAKDAILTFDSGVAITAAAACQSVMITGSSGAGKTSSAILPCMAKLVEMGFGGLVVDIKGNVGTQLREIARLRGRENDVVEFGSSSFAKKINLLDGMTIAQVRELLRIIATFQFGTHTGNLDWHVKGVGLAVDCIVLIQYLQKKHPEILVSLASLRQILNDWTLAAKMFDYFKDAVYDDSNSDQRDFFKKIQSDNFHPLICTDKKSANNTYQEQTTWRLGAIRNGLSEFLEPPGIFHNFATSGDGLDIEKLIYKQRKIVLLRFGNADGNVGAWLSRYVLTEYYKTTYTHGLNLGKDDYTFFIADEFQEFCDFTPGNRYNDNSFASKAREYHAIQVTATQSISSLASRGASSAAVSEYINNINNRVMMYSDDPVTQGVAERYDDNVQLNKLRPGEAFVLRFDNETRRHVHSVETMQNSHDVLRAELGVLPQSTEIIDDSENQESPLQVVLDIIGAREVSDQKIKQETAQRKEEERAQQHASVPQSTSVTPDFDEAKDDKETKVTIPEHLAPIVERFQQYFASLLEGSDPEDLCVPAGWLNALENALHAFSATGLSLDISSFGLNSGGLAVVTHRLGGMMGVDVGVHIFNRLLATTRHLCPICGEKLPVPKEGEVDQPCCRECSDRFGIAPARAVVEPTERNQRC